MERPDVALSVVCSDTEASEKAEPENAKSPENPRGFCELKR